MTMDLRCRNMHRASTWRPRMVAVQSPTGGRGSSRHLSMPLSTYTCSRRLQSLACYPFRDRSYTNRCLSCLVCRQSLDHNGTINSRILGLQERSLFRCEYPSFVSLASHFCCLCLPGTFSIFQATRPGSWLRSTTLLLVGL